MPKSNESERFVPKKPSSGLRQLGKAFKAPPDGGQVIIALLVAAMGFGIALQVRGDEEDQLAQARRTDLVQILSDLNQRSVRLEQEVTDLRAARNELQSGADSESVALEQTQQRARQLAVLAGTAPASGSGIVVQIPDPTAGVFARHMLGVVQELRIAGAEAIQIAGSNRAVVRVTGSTYFVDDDGDGALVVDGTVITQPYELTAIGDASALAATITFPSSAAVIQQQATVEEHERVVVDALREPAAPQYARPASDDD